MKRFWITFGLCIFVVVSLAYASAPSEYWISFSHSRGRRFVVKIDASGRIIVPHKKISGLHTGIFEDVGTNLIATGLSPHEPNGLNLWTFSRDGTIYRQVLNKTTLEPVHLIRTSQKSVNRLHLQIATEGTQDFLAVTKQTGEGNHLFGVPINAIGILQGQQLRLSDQLISGEDINCSDLECGGGVSGDGRIAWIQDLDYPPSNSKLYIQRLNRNQPIGKPVVIDETHGFTRHFFGTDVTGSLSGSIRYVVYVKRVERSDPEKVYLQKIHSATGEKVADRIFLFEAFMGPGQGIAIDPKGKFLITVEGADLVYRALNATGMLSGSPIILVKGQVSGAIDLLRDSSN